MIRGSRRIKPRKRRSTRRGGGPSASKSKSDYFITLHDNTSVWIHKPEDTFLLREGDIVSGIEYLNTGKTMQFKLRSVGTQQGELNKLRFQFVKDGKVRKLHMAPDGKRLEVNDLEIGISIDKHQFSVLAESIQKVK